jgi:hypothetical protein
MCVRYWLALAAKTKSGGVASSQAATAFGLASR